MIINKIELKWVLDKCLDKLEEHYHDYHGDNTIAEILDFYKKHFD